jgi:hypothetical protein
MPPSTRNPAFGAPIRTIFTCALSAAACSVIILNKAMRDKHTSRVAAPRRGEEGRRARSPAKDGKPGVPLSRSAPERAGRGAQRPVRTMGDRQDRSRVFVQLSEDQVDQVIGSAAYAEAGDGALDGHGADGLDGRGAGGRTRAQDVGKRSGRKTQWLFSTLMDDRSLSHSLLIGLEVLTCFPLDGTERGVAEIAKQLGMNNSTVHRYMSTLMRVGLLEQNPYTRLYRLGTGEVDGSAR